MENFVTLNEVYCKGGHMYDSFCEPFLCDIPNSIQKQEIKVIQRLDAKCYYFGVVEFVFYYNCSHTYIQYEYGVEMLREHKRKYQKKIICIQESFCGDTK